VKLDQLVGTFLFDNFVKVFDTHLILLGSEAFVVYFYWMDFENYKFWMKFCFLTPPCGLFVDSAEWSLDKTDILWLTPFLLILDILLLIFVLWVLKRVKDV